MRDLFRSLALVVSILISGMASIAQAEPTDSPVSASASVGLYSDYVYRGFNLFEGGSIQPSLTVNYDTGAGVLSGNVWMHATGDSDSPSAKFFEMDDTISYSMNFDPATIEVGHVWYTYPGDEDLEDTAEFYGTVTLDDSELNPIFSLSPTFSVYHDYDLIDGQYYEVGLSHLFKSSLLGEGFNFTPSLALGFANDQRELYADDGLVQATYGVSSNLTLGDIGVVPSINYTQELDDNLTNEFWFGTAFNYDF